MGANVINGVGFGFSDPGALLRQAREAAMNDAWTKGQQYAGLGGVTLGLPLLIDDIGANTLPRAEQPNTAGFFAPGSPNTTIVPGEQQVRVDINVVYAIK